MEAPEGTTYAFTDGSCLTNPGPCGAGAVVFPYNHEPVRLKRPVSKRGFILLGELIAILLVLEYLVQNIASLPCKRLKIFCDSQSAVGILHVTLGWKDTSYKDVVSDIKKVISILKQKDVPTQLDWTPGHSAIAGNEIADRLAKEAAKEAETFADDRKSTSIAEVKMTSKKQLGNSLKTVPLFWDENPSQFSGRFFVRSKRVLKIAYLSEGINRFFENSRSVTKNRPFCL